MVDLALNHNAIQGSIPSFIFTQYSNLQILSVLNNELTGSLPFTDIYVHNNRSNVPLNDSVYGYTTSLLLNLDISNNYLTGTFPSIIFFLFPYLHSFLANNNCFDLNNLFGTFQNSSIVGYSSNATDPLICQATSLSQIAMDGLSSNPQCRTFVFSTIMSKRIRTYFVSLPLTPNTIPPCIFSLPQILSIHLSGNGLVGTIPSLNVYGGDNNDVNISTTGSFISQSLIELALSYNRLSGTIPESIQLHGNWKYLDLSYNKLSGKILPDNKWYLNNGALTDLYLEVNRLSDIVPSNLLNLEVVSILRGNLFDCPWSSGVNSLPKNDPIAETYNCGSSLADTVFITWTIIMILLAVLLAIFIVDHYYRNNTRIVAAESTDRKRVSAHLRYIP